MSESQRAFPAPTGYAISLRHNNQADAERFSSVNEQWASGELALGEHWRNYRFSDSFGDSRLGV